MISALLYKLLQSKSFHIISCIMPTHELFISQYTIREVFFLCVADS